jgi:hypothetical protein
MGWAGLGIHVLVLYGKYLKYILKMTIPELAARK